MSGFARTHGRVERTPEKSSARPMAKKNEPRRRAVDPTMEETRLPFEFDQLLVERSPEARMQAKLKVHGSDDLWEREADANADSVLRALGGQTEPAELRLTPLVGGIAADTTSGPVQRQEEEEEEELLQAKRVGGGARKLGAATGEQIRALRGGGRPLPATIRSEFEAQFGCDFGQVRIHAESKAAEVAALIGARAFTTGQDVVFANGEYRPEDREGQRLLAHELTHVVQQTRPGSSPPGGDAIQRKRAAVPATPRKALDTALKGDDDDVRELTQSKVWPGLDVKSRESATLMEHLLDGATLDEDEQAGIKVLTKAQQQNRVDDALEEIDSRGRFSQLLDDYHGAEYRELLKLLSTAIKRRKVKALYLDAFIAMWWLNKAEEEAVVVLLEKSSGPDVAALLNESNRLGEFRSDIDDAGLAKRFEEKVGAGNAADFKVLKKQLTAIFKIEGRKAVGRKTMQGRRLTKADVEALLKGAAKDLATELTHYKAEIEAATKGGNAASIREINIRFKGRLKRLLVVKGHEFNLELKWNKEFNRALDRSFARNWTIADLDKMDKILRAIPPQFVYANERNREFRRASTDPKNPTYAGLAGPTYITLFKKLERGVTTHEFGHTIHDDAPTFHAEFGKISKWKRFDASGLYKLVKDEGLPNGLPANLDQHRLNKANDAFVTHGGFNYRWARYGDPKTYWRYLSSARFVSTYARTNPNEDFAETFESFLFRPEKDKGKAPKKFEFMYREIFVRYLLRKESDRVKKEFTGVGSGLEDNVKDARLRTLVWKHGGLPVKKSLLNRLAHLETAKFNEVINAKPRKRIPVKGWSEAWKVGEAHIELLRRVYRYGAELSRRFEKFKVGANARKTRFKKSLRDAYTDLVKSLEKDFAKRLGPLMKRPSQEILKGEAAKPESWPELDAEITGLQRLLKVADSYVGYHRRYLRARDRWKLGASIDATRKPEEDFDDFALKLLRRFPPGSLQQKHLRPAIEMARFDLILDFDIQRDKLLELIGKKRRFRKRRLVEPRALVSRYRSKVRRYYARVRRGKPAIPLIPLKGAPPK